MEAKKQAGSADGQAYIKGPDRSLFLFVKSSVFDIKRKEYLRTLGKYYIVDIGLRNYLLGFREETAGIFWRMVFSLN